MRPLNLSQQRSFFFVSLPLEQFMDLLLSRHLHEHSYDPHLMALNVRHIYIDGHGQDLRNSALPLLLHHVFIQWFKNVLKALLLVEACSEVDKAILAGARICHCVLLTLPSFVQDDSKNCEEWDQNGEEDYQDGFDTSRFFVHNFRNQGWIIWVLVVSIIRLNGVNWYERRIYNRWRRVTHVAPCSQRSDPAELIADKASYLLPLSELQGVCFVERCGLTTGHFDASVRSSLE